MTDCESSASLPFVTIRVATPNDLAALEELYPQAFPEEDLLPLIRDLVNLGPPTVLSLVAIDDATKGGDILGHAMFTMCTMGDDNVSLLGPLAVHPDRQNQGIGSALVRNGIQRLQKDKDAGTVLLVLGSPQYYCRFGFQQENDIVPPHPLPDKWRSAWQSLYLPMETRQNPPRRKLAGKLIVPREWQAKELWS